MLSWNADITRKRSYISFNYQQNLLWKAANNNFQNFLLRSGNSLKLQICESLKTRKKKSTLLNLHLLAWWTWIVKEGGSYNRSKTHHFSAWNKRISNFPAIALMVSHIWWGYNSGQRFLEKHGLAACSLSLTQKIAFILVVAGNTWHRATCVGFPLFIP